MKEWISEKVDRYLKAELDNFLDGLRNDSKLNLDCEKHFHEKFHELEGKIKKGFQDEYGNYSNSNLYSEMENYLISHLNRLKTDSFFDLNNLIHRKKIKIYDVEGEDHIKRAIGKVKKNPSSFPDEKKKEEYFEQVWQDVEKKLASSFNREKEGQSLFKVIRDHYQSILVSITGGLPKSEFNCLVENKFDEYLKYIQEEIDKQYHQSASVFEYSKSAPSSVLKGGKTNVSFKYFDMRKYFTEDDCEEYLSINRSKLSQIFDVSKIRQEFKQYCQNPSYEKAISDMVHDLLYGLKLCGVDIQTKSFEEYMDYKASWALFRIFKSEPQPKFNDIAQLPEVPNYFPQKYKQYFDIEKLKKLFSEYLDSKTTKARLVAKVIKDGIKWDFILSLSKDKAISHFKQQKLVDIVSKLSQDLKKLNIAFHESLEEIVLSIAQSNELDGIIVQNFAYQATRSVKTIGRIKEIIEEEFHYIQRDKLKEALRSIPDQRDSDIIIAKLKFRKFFVKRDYKDIMWLEYYVNEDFSKLFSNSAKNDQLYKFVFKEFKFNNLVENIFKILKKKIQSETSWNSKSFYQSLCREVNEEIGIANNDLQQVAYHLDFKLAGYLHLCVVHLIWKHFELINWKKITEPLESMNQRKEKQKKYFLAMTSANSLKINSIQADKFSESILNYIKTYLIQPSKKKLINSLSLKCKKEGARDRIQRYLDEKYFGRGQVVTHDELYFYILNPYEVLEKTYQELTEKYIKEMNLNVANEKDKIVKLINALVERLQHVRKVLNHFDEDSFYFENVFEFKTYSSEIGSDVLFQRYDDKLSIANLKFILGLIHGNRNTGFETYGLDDQTTVGIREKMREIRVEPLDDVEVKAILNYLSSDIAINGGITNGLIFLGYLITNVENIKNNLDTIFIVEDQDIQSFKNEINFYICKQKCPCCDRICGEDDPNHKYHQCKYGHQMRAIGGIKLSNDDASVSRCEDINDLDIMQYNGMQKNWLQFKEEMKNHPNSPWIFDDLQQTRGDKEACDRFKFAWKEIGPKICSERYKHLNMKYVEYNQANIEAQKIKTSREKYYIFVIDSSGSMTGGKWNDLLASLKKTLGKVHTLNENNKVTIINFSSQALVEYSGASPDSINVNSLKFQGGGTDFHRALLTALDHIKVIKHNEITMVFMTDGEACYPTSAVTSLKQYIQSPNFNKKFSFYGIEFKCTTNVIKQLVSELGGNTYFAEDAEGTTSAYFEILDKDL